MSIGLLKWYNNLNSRKQIAIAFIFNGLLWFAASLLKDKVFYDEPHSLSYHIIDTLWMAAFMTVLFNWKGVRALFKRN